MTEPAPAPAPASRNVVRRALTVGVAVIAVAFVVWVVPFKDQCNAEGVCKPGLLTTLRGANALLLIVLFGAYLLGTLVWSARWRALLGLAKVDVPLMSVWRVTLEAQAGGILLPGGVAGDALRVAYVRARAGTSELGKVVASILADRVVGLVTLALIAIFAGVAFGAQSVGLLLYALVCIPIGALSGWFLLRHPKVQSARILNQGVIGRLAQPALQYAIAEGGPKTLARGFVLSLVVSAVQLAITRGLLLALGVPPTHEAWVYVGTTFAMMVSAVPLLPGAWGTADAAYVFFLGQAGVPPSAALAVCLLYRIFWYSSGVIGAVSALVRRP